MSALRIFRSPRDIVWEGGVLPTWKIFAAKELSSLPIR